MKYIFKQIDDISGAEAVTTIEFSAVTLQNVLEHFEMFLRGSGFHTPGTLDFIPDEEYYGDGHDGMGSTLEDYPESIYDGDLNSPSVGVFNEKGNNAY